MTCVKVSALGSDFADCIFGAERGESSSMRDTTKTSELHWLIGPEAPTLR